MNEFEKAMEIFKYNRAIEHAVTEYMKAKPIQWESSRSFFTMPDEVTLTLSKYVADILNNDKTSAIAVATDERLRLIREIQEKEREITALCLKLNNAYKVGEELACDYFRSES
jgi:hypothetical protein